MNGIIDILFEVTKYLDVYEYEEVVKNNSRPLNNWCTPEMVLKIFIERAINKSRTGHQIACLTLKEQEDLFKLINLMARSAIHYYEANEEIKALIGKKGA